MTPAEKQAARDRIAALRARWERTENTTSFGQARAMAHARYVNALASLVDELTAPEPEDLTRDLERSIVKVRTERACGISKNVRRAR